MNALVVCIGNELVADDAIGFEVHQRLAGLTLPGVRLAYCAVGGIALLDLLDGSADALIVVDAVCFGAPAGTLHCMDLDAIPAVKGQAISAHGIGLRETLDIGRALYAARMPTRVHLIGVEGRCFDRPRAHMSPEVAAALEPAVQTILSLLSDDSSTTHPVRSPPMSVGKTTAYDTIDAVAKAMIEGRLDVRGDTTELSGHDAELVGLVNTMLDTLISPMRLAANALDEIAHGRIPAFVIDERKGEYDKIKQSINTLLAVLYGMHREVLNLTDSVREGRLRTRGNDWDYEGIWQELIAGMNQTLDVVVDPMHEAADVLGKLAAYDLNARMRGRYRGEHAAIRDAMNATAETLHGAIAQVTGTVELASGVGQRVMGSSSTVADGAEAQKRRLADAAGNIEKLAESARHSAKNTEEAQRNAQQAAGAVTTAKHSMEGMLAAMFDISSSAESTATIVTEIDFIATETRKLSTSASEKALRVKTSARGFGVVAEEVRKLSARCIESAAAMAELQRKVAASADKALRGDIGTLIDALNELAIFSNLLGMNAAIEAAHVGSAGADFSVLTEEIHSLATRSTEAARRTETLIRNAVDQSKSGVRMSREIDKHLAEAAEGAETISRLADEISTATMEQAGSIEQIKDSVTEIHQVTQKNASSAAESRGAASDLNSQMSKLSVMVKKFKV